MTEPPWWHRAAVYQVYPRSFRDADGDGTGDLRGVIAGLPYLAALGVNAIWLSPFYPSPLLDSGYDVADPRGVDPRYGTLADARELIDEAHARGLRVIVDVVPNHTSSERDWFRAALASESGSTARQRYHFRDGRGPGGAEPPTNWMSWFGGSAWTRVTEADGSPGQWYLHTFDSSQPDLNWANPEVREDALSTLRFWLDLGVDGFRVDVALGLAKDPAYPDLDDAEGIVQAMRMDLDDGSPQAMARRRQVVNSAVLDRDEVQDIYREWRRVMDSHGRDIMAVAEAWLPPERAARYVAPDTLHQVFNFDFMGVSWDAGRIAAVIRETMSGLAPVGAPATWALSNHDTPRVVSRLGGGAEGLRRARALALVAHVLPGAVYVYQGEELGLPDADLPDERRQDPVFRRTGGLQKGRDGARVPLPWSGPAAPYGFGGADTWLPQPGDWADRTVSAQEADPRSTLSMYRALLLSRRAHPGLAVGQPWSAEVQHDSVLVVRRGCGLICAVNLGSVAVRIADLVTGPVTVILASDEAAPEWLQPSSGAWLQT